MSNLSKTQESYLQKKTEIEDIKLKINAVDEEIQGLNKKVGENQADIAAIKGRLENSSIDLASGELSSADFLALKQTIREKETLIEGLLEVVEAQKNAKIELSGHDFFTGLKKEIRIFANIKRDLADLLAPQSMTNALNSNNGEIKDVIKLIASGQKHSISSGVIGGTRGNIYSDVGKALCDALFPLNANGSQEMTFEELKKDVDTIFEALA